MNAKNKPVQKGETPFLDGAVEPLPSMDCWGKEFPDYNEDGIAIMRNQLRQLEEVLKESGVGRSDFLDVSGYSIHTVEDLIRAVNTYRMSPSYENRLKKAIHSSELYSTQYAEITCTSEKITADSNLKTLLLECQRIDANLSLVHSDLLRADMHYGWPDEFCIQVDAKQENKLQQDKKEAQEVANYHLETYLEKRLQLLKLYEQTISHLLQTDMDIQRRWLKEQNFYPRNERPRRGYKEASEIDGRIPSLEDYLPTAILIARDWIWRNYAKIIHTRDTFEPLDSAEYKACLTLCPQIAQKAHKLLRRHNYLQKDSMLIRGEFIRHYMPPEVEHIEEVYRRLDYLEPTFADKEKTKSVITEFDILN